MDALAADKRPHPTDDMISHLIAGRGRARGRHRRAPHRRGGGPLRRCCWPPPAPRPSPSWSATRVMTFAEHPDELAKLQGRPVAGRIRGRGGAALQGAVAVPGPLLRWPTASSTARRSRPGSRCSSSPAPPTATSAPTTTPTASTSSAPGPLGITFGHGIHYCIGAHLARLEGRTAFNELYRRWPEPPGRPRRHQVRPHGQRRRPLVGARGGLSGSRLRRAGTPRGRTSRSPRPRRDR